MPSGWGSPVRQLADFWIGPRRTCGNADSAGRLDRSPSERSSLRKRRLGLMTRRLHGVSTSSVVSFANLGIFLAPGSNLSGLWPSARQRSAPMAPTWRRGAAISAACPRSWGTCPVPGSNSSGLWPSARQHSAPPTPLCAPCVATLTASQLNSEARSLGSYRGRKILKSSTWDRLGMCAWPCSRRFPLEWVIESLADTADRM